MIATQLGRGKALQHHGESSLTTHPRARIRGQKKCLHAALLHVAAVIQTGGSSF